MKEIYYKYKVFLIPAIIGVICVTILILVVIPQILGYFKEQDKIQTLKTRIELLNDKAKELQNIDEEARKNDLVVALTVLPTEKDVPRTMSMLQDLIVKSNLILKATTYSQQSKSAGKDGFGFNISVVGPPSSVRDFLNELQNAPFLAKVNSITLTFQGTGSIIDAAIPLTIFYEPAPKTAVTLDQPITTISDKEEELLKKLSKNIVQPNVVTSTTAATMVPLGKLDLFE